MSRSLSLSSVCLGLMLGITAFAVAADPSWPFLRGQNYDGVSSETSVADQWPEQGPPVLWVQPLGQGYSGFVADRDRVYTQRQTLGGQYVVCLNADTGNAIWEYRYGLPYETVGLYPGPRATPTLHGGRVYFAGTDGTVGCLSGSGKLLWSVALFKEFGGPGAGFGYACSPVVVEGLVLLPVGGPGASFVALDALTGKTVWKVGDDAASYTPAFPITVDGQQQVIGYLENALVAHDLRTGKRIWRYKLSHGYDEHSAWPLYREPHLWISSPFRGGSQLLRLSTEPGKAPETVWQSSILSNDILSSVLVGDHIYGFDLSDVQAKPHRPSRGSFRCLEFLTGEECWSTDETGHASLIVADGKLILLNDKGELILARASPERYEELARCSVLGGEICWTPPLLHRGRLYARNQSRAVCVYLGTPERFAGEKLARTPIAVADLPQTRFRDLWVLLGVEPEYAMDVPSWPWLHKWYVIGLAILAASGCAAGLAHLFRARPVATEIVFYGVAFVLGAIGTTVLSRLAGEFMFTWYLPVFITFDACLTQQPPVAAQTSSRLRRRIPGLIFMLTCAAYFLLCRRLSLVVEWAFLFGFPAALLIGWPGYRLARMTRWPVAVRVVITALCFSAFYWSVVAVLMWKYEIPE